MIALFPGSFDPFTNGHLDVAERVCAIADRLVIGVGVNPAKRGLIAPEERVRLIREATGHLGGVEVVLLQGATMDEASRLGATPPRRSSTVRSGALTPGGFRPVRPSHTSPQAPCANSWV